MKKRLSAITGNINITGRSGPDPEITGIFYDSRRVIPGGLFVATDGLHTDGHRFIPAALEKGAAAVLASRPADCPPEVAFLLTENPRLCLSSLASAFYDHPSRRLKVIGVTGTDGKTSTVFLIHQLLSLSGKKSGFLSTATYQAGGEILKNPYRQSTPEAPEVQEILAEIAGAGCEYAAIETTSHGLSPRTGRLADVRFEAGVFTNITHEHLEFHGTFEVYRQDKSRLFSRLEAGSSGGIINRDDPQWAFFAEAARKNSPEVPLYTYSRSDGEADLYCREIRQDQAGSTFRLGGADTDLPVRLNIPGNFNIENTLAALLAVRAVTGAPLEELVPLVPRLTGVKGRMKTVDRGQPFTVIVDYAHTPGAFEKILPDIRTTARGRVIALFGSAGERDVAKRPMLGALAHRYCDILVLTDEDPRGEVSQEILEEIAAGAPGRTRGEDLFLVPDRRQAMLEAFRLARPEDTVLLLGKGHESTIIYADGPIPWDEEETARECLALTGHKG